MIKDNNMTAKERIEAMVKERLEVGMTIEEIADECMKHDEEAREKEHTEFKAREIESKNQIKRFASDLIREKLDDTCTLLHKMYKYQDPEFYSKKTNKCLYYLIEDFCVEFFFAYKKYLFMENKTDSDLVFYRFCSYVEYGKVPCNPAYAEYDISRFISVPISVFVSETYWMFDWLFDCEGLQSDGYINKEYVPKALEVIFYRLNDLRKRKDI